MDANGVTESLDNISVLSDMEGMNIAETTQPDGEGGNRKGWKLIRCGNDNVENPPQQPARGVALRCQMKASVRGACLISCASIVELVGNMIAIVYGITYVQKVCTFFDGSNDPDRKDHLYEEQLQRVNFLQDNQVGFIGILATCFIGLLVSFLMPIGAIYRSWKSLRVAMSLLLSMCLAHMVLACVYLKDSILLMSLIIIPFRLAELTLIYRHIRNYKRKKLEAVLLAMSLAGSSNDPPAPVDDNAVESRPDSGKKSKSRGRKNKDLADRTLEDGNGNARMGSLRVNSQQLKSGNQFSNRNQMGMELNDDGQAKPKERKLSKKRRAQLAWLAEQERQLAAGQKPAPTSGNFSEFK